MDLMTETTADGLEVLNKYAPAFQAGIDRVLQSKPDGEDAALYIHNKYKVVLDIIGKGLININKKDYKELDILFTQYKDFCHIYNIVPTLEGFSILLSWSNSNIYHLDEHLRSADYRANKESSYYIQKWRAACKREMIEQVSQEKGADVNRIFILKALHGLAETTAQTPEEIEKRTSGEIGGRYLLE